MVVTAVTATRSVGATPAGLPGAPGAGTGPSSPVLAAAAIEAVGLMQEDPTLHTRLRANTARVRSLLRLKTIMDEWMLREQTSTRLGVLGGGATMGSVDTTQAKILVVEDNAIDAANFIEALSSDAHDIQRVTTVQDGLAAASSGDHDLVVCGLDLRAGDPLRLLSQIRANDASRQTPILMIGPSDQVDRLAKALDLGANDYVIRPFDRNELKARVRTQVRRRRFLDLLRQN